jgi:hypothetical protein
MEILGHCGMFSEDSVRSVRFCLSPAKVLFEFEKENVSNSALSQIRLPPSQIKFEGILGWFTSLMPYPY